MKVLVMGAAGRTGRAVVRRAVKQGHQVTAFVHSVGAYDVPGVAVRTGDATDGPTMERAVSDQDAVIEAVGGKVPYRRTTLEGDVAAAVVEAMQRHSVRRLVAISMYGEGDSATNAALYVKIAKATFLRGEAPDKARKEAAISASTLDWVIVRPPVLTDRSATGDVRIFPAGGRSRPHVITRDDLAAFMVDQLTSDDHVKTAVTVANR